MPVVDPATSYDDVVAGFDWTIPESFNIGETVRKSGSVRDDTALVHVDGTGHAHEFTYRELDDAAASVAAHLEAAGVEPGDRVAMCFPQSPELLVAHLATYRLGCIAVPLSVLLGDDAARHSLTDSGASALVADGEVYADLEPVLADVDLSHRLVVDVDGGNYAGPARALGGFAGHVDGDGDRDVVETAADDPAIIVYTSGTTGKPKGVVQTHQYLLGTLPGYQCWFHLFGETHRERVWTPAEWSWAGALFDAVFPTLAMGGTVVSHARRTGFDPGRALELVADVDVSRAFMPPTALWQIRDQCDPTTADLTDLEVLMCGGEKLSTPLRRWAERELDVVVNEAYGQTEANALVGNCQALFEAKEGSMGRLYPGHECRVVGEDGEPVAPGEIGEIVVELPDPVVFEGYWNDEAATTERFSEGVYRTGDLATVDEDGYFRFVGRTDDLILTAGYRVGPAEVESALCDVPGVTEAAVGGVPDEERGQRIKAYVLLAETPGSGPSPDDIRQHVRESLGPHKTPDEIVVRDDVPKTRSGKIDRASLFPH